MQVSAQPKEWRVEVSFADDPEEACYVYDLVQSGRLLVEDKNHLPLPFRGQFLFKLPDRPRPITIQVARFEASAEETLAGQGGLRLLIAPDRGPEELLAEVETALRDVPPVSEE